jgi:DNA invertase Pin-like site-specific DNA recombinase
MKIAAYCRVSTDKDAQLESLENQKRFFTEFAQKYNHELIKIYADEGISGKQMKNRTEFLRMLEDAKLHTFEMVVVKDISRFARNTVDFLNAVRELKSENIEVTFLSTNQTILGGSEFILTIFSALAQEESANLSKRVKFGLNESAKKGRAPSIIYGYDSIGNRKLKINDNEAEVVRTIFDMYVNQGLGTRKIGLLLDEKGIITKKGTDKWIPRTIRRMIMNPIYMGVLENRKYQTTDFLTGKKVLRPKEDYIVHELPEYQIVSKEIFDKAQVIMGQRQELYKNETTHMTGHYSNRHLFSTLIKCEHCGYSFCRRKFYTQKSGDIIYWKCSGNNNRTSLFCPNTTTVTEKELLDQLKKHLESIVVNKDKVKNNIISELNNRLYKIADDFDVKASTKQLKKINTMQDKYKVMFANDVITIDELKTKIKELESQKTDLQKKIEDINTISNKLENQDKLLDKEINEINQFLAIDPNEWTNIQLRNILHNVTVSVNGDIVFNLKLFNIN